MRRNALPIATLLMAVGVPGSAMPAELADGAGRDEVQAHCSGCHSLALVAQNRGDRDHWLKLICWMQREQGLWPLGDDEAIILDYLASNYGAPASTPRRRPLQTQWYDSDAGD